MARPFRALIARDGDDADGNPIDIGDGRAFPAGAFVWRTPPLSVMALTTTSAYGGHDGAFLLGNMATIERDGDVIMATGTLNDEGEGEDADRRRDTIAAIERGDLNGVSVDPAGVEVHYECVEFDEEDGWCVRELIVFDSYTIGGATVCTVPGIEGTLMELLPSTTSDGASNDSQEEDAAAAAVAASAALTLERPPVEWFAMPEAAELTPLTVTPDGQVYGHLASWDSCHISFPDRCVQPWRSQCNYAQFRLHAFEAEGVGGEVVQIAVGVIAATGGHFPTTGPDAGNWRGAQAHYDDPATCAAYVAAIDGELGPWVCGSLRPGVTSEQVAVLRSHQVSGDWRRIAGHMELVGVCSVNTPGFPIPRSVAMAASGTPGEDNLEPVAAIVPGVGATCHECGGHETPLARTASARSLTATAFDERLARAERMIAVLEGHVGPDVRERLRAQLR